MRFAIRSLAATTLSVLAACGSITDPTGPSAFPSDPSFAKGGGKPPRPPKPQGTPILFVHGWNSTGGIWTTMIGRFKTDGWTDARLHAFSYNTAVSNATTAGIIGSKVDSILVATGASKVAIVSHSMGSLSARYYVKNVLGADGKVSAFVSLAGANHGTQTAGTCVFLFGQTSCAEMLPGSTFLTALNADDETPGITAYATWRSPCDNVISPQSSTVLDGATNTLTSCLQHGQLYTDATVYGQVRSFVNQTAPSAFIASAR